MCSNPLIFFIANCGSDLYDFKQRPLILKISFERVDLLLFLLSFLLDLILSNLSKWPCEGDKRFLAIEILIDNVTGLTCLYLQR